MARPKVKGETKAINLNIDAKLYEEVDDFANTTGISKTFLIEKALKEYLDKKKEVLNSLK